jgi:Flp pilus assembly protein TadB
VVPGSAAQRRVVAYGERVERELWSLAGRALDGAPQASAPRLYVESLNEAIDSQAARVAGLQNRVPSEVLWLEVGGAALALALLSAYLAVLGRAAVAVVLAAVLVALLLLVTCDLDRPTRGLIRIPAKPLVAVRAEMALPPATSGSEGP